MKKWILASLLVLLAPFARSQSFSVVTAPAGVTVDNGSGGAINPPSGSNLCFLGVNNRGVTVTYTPLGGGPVTGAVCQTLNSSGALTGSLQVANPATATVSGGGALFYTITVTHSSTTYLTLPIVSLSGAVFNFTSFALPVNGSGSGIGYPHLGCNAGAGFASTTLGFGSNSFVCHLVSGIGTWLGYPAGGAYCSAGLAYQTPQISGTPFCLAPIYQGIGAPSGSCLSTSFYFQNDSPGTIYGCYNSAWTVISGSGGPGLTSFQGRTTAAATLQAVDVSGILANAPFGFSASGGLAFDSGSGIIAPSVDWLLAGGVLTGDKNLNLAATILGSPTITLNAATGAASFGSGTATISGAGVAALAAGSTVNASPICTTANASSTCPSTGGSFYQTAQNATVALTQRPKFNFINSSGIIGADNSGNASTDISLSAIPNASLANASITINCTGGCTGGGTVSLGGSTTINVTASGGLPTPALDNAVVFLDPGAAGTISNSQFLMSAACGLSGSGLIGGGICQLTNVASVGTANPNPFAMVQVGSGSSGTDFESPYYHTIGAYVTAVSASGAQVENCILWKSGVGDHQCVAHYWGGSAGPYYPSDQGGQDYFSLGGEGPGTTFVVTGVSGNTITIGSTACSGGGSGAQLAQQLCTLSVGSWVIASSTGGIFGRLISPSTALPSPMSAATWLKQLGTTASLPTSSVYGYANGVNLAPTTTLDVPLSESFAMQGGVGTFSASDPVCILGNNYNEESVIGSVSGTSPTQTITLPLTRNNQSIAMFKGHCGVMSFDASYTGFTGSTHLRTSYATVSIDGSTAIYNVQAYGTGGFLTLPQVNSELEVVAPPFATTTVYTVGQNVYDGTGTELVTTGGTSGGSAPSWNNSAIGNTTTSGGAVFTYMGLGRSAFHYFVAAMVAKANNIGSTLAPSFTYTLQPNGANFTIGSSGESTDLDFQETQGIFEDVQCLTPGGCNAAVFQIHGLGAGGMPQNAAVQINNTNPSAIYYNSANISTGVTPPNGINFNVLAPGSGIFHDYFAMATSPSDAVVSVTNLLPGTTSFYLYKSASFLSPLLKIFTGGSSALEIQLGDLIVDQTVHAQEYDIKNNGKITAVDAGSASNITINTNGGTTFIGGGTFGMSVDQFSKIQFQGTGGPILDMDGATMRFLTAAGGPLALILGTNDGLQTELTNQGSSFDYALYVGHNTGNVPIFMDSAYIKPDGTAQYTHLTRASGGSNYTVTLPNAQNAITGGALLSFDTSGNTTFIQGTPDITDVPSTSVTIGVATTINGGLHVTGSGYNHAQIGANVFSALPSCVSGVNGTSATVTDSTTAIYGATITGSGSNSVGAYCNGTNWTVAAGGSGSGGGNTVSTSLTTNSLTKANGANSIINSLFTDNGSLGAYNGTNGFSTANVQLVGGGGIAAYLQFTEGTSVGGTTGFDLIRGDVTGHRLVMNNNSVSSLFIVGHASAGTAGDCTQLAANGIDIIDSGSSSCGAPSGITGVLYDSAGTLSAATGAQIIAPIASGVAGCSNSGFYLDPADGICTSIGAHTFSNNTGFVVGRVYSTEYHNTTGGPMFVNVTANTGAGPAAGTTTLRLSSTSGGEVDYASCSAVAVSSGVVSCNVSLMVPAGWYYEAASSGTQFIQMWDEAY